MGGGEGKWGGREGGERGIHYESWRIRMNRGTICRRRVSLCSYSIEVARFLLRIPVVLCANFTSSGSGNSSLPSV